MKKAHPFFIISVCVLVFLTGCNKSTVYHTYQSLPNNGWAKTDTLVFDIDVLNSLEHYVLFTQVRNRNNYPYQNLSLSIIHNLGDTCIWSEKILNYSLTNKDGQWNGNGWGALYQNSYELMELVNLQPGTHTIRISHNMKDSVLVGISDIGIRIDRN